VYLTDVDDDAGPFVYAAGTHLKKGAVPAPAYLFKDGSTPRSDDSQMSQVVSAEHWVKCVGPKGTVVFADTRGFHKGGLARGRERILYVCEFFSQGAGRGGISTYMPMRPAG
jgi:hypothetical protein